MKNKKDLKDKVMYIRINDDLLSKCIEIGKINGIDTLSMVVRVAMLEYIKNHSKANLNG